MASKERDGEITFAIKENIGVIGSYQTGWKKELNLVEWNGNAAKFDLRDWDPEHKHMSRGITFYRDEADKLAQILTEFFKNESVKEETEMPF